MRIENEFCPVPFQCIEIHKTGAVYTCCPNWNKFYEIGNIYKDSFEDIWNSEAAQNLRQKILKSDYSLCDSHSCFYLQNHDFSTAYETDYKAKMDEYPAVIKFAYDPECNIACRICRKELHRLSNEQLELFNSKIDTQYIPMLKHAKRLIINSSGDPFGSRHSRLLIQKAAATYPDLKFTFHTNGILCNKEMFANLNITPHKIAEFLISIHAANEKTYNKIVPGYGKLHKQITKNLGYLKELRKENPFKVYLNFVVTSINYKEIPDFIKLAEKYDASPHFWEFRQDCCDYQNQDNLNICSPNHSLHKELKKVLKHSSINKYKENFSPALIEIINS